MMQKTVICKFLASDFMDERCLFSLKSLKESIYVLVGIYGSLPTENDNHIIVPLSPDSVSGIQVLYVAVDTQGCLIFILNGKLIHRKHLGITAEIEIIVRNKGKFKHFSVIDYVPDFTVRKRLTDKLALESGLNIENYPVLHYKNMLISSDLYNFRDPSEVINYNGRYWLYFTGTDKDVMDGFTGDIWCSSCDENYGPSCPENWSAPQRVIAKGNRCCDHDGTGCFTPDCFYDGEKFFLFYTGLNSDDPKGLPYKNGGCCPEHIMVAKSKHPDCGFLKPAKPDISVTRSLPYSCVTVPGGHERANGRKIIDDSLIDHGQYWVMDDGERRYYYKGGRAGQGGRVFLVRHLDQNWLNGQRYGRPIIDEGTHMEGILICRVDNVLYMQLSLIWKTPKWRTYSSEAQDGINWKLIDEGYLPKPGENYPMSIGFNSTIDPEWALGQFPYDDGKRIGIGFLDVF
jgi:hypothetical protein